MTDSTSVWGDEQTRFFFDLTPDRVLEAVEAAGLLCTGRCSALGSYENRVYEVELEREDEHSGASPPRGDRSTASARFANRRVVKFYRPGRWSEAQIWEEHEFLLDLLASEIPVVAPLPFSSGKTLQQTPAGIWYAVFPKVGGRAPEEMTHGQLKQLGRLLARIHQVGSTRRARHRIELNPTSYGRQNLKALLEGDWIPLEYRSRYEAAVLGVCEVAESLFLQTPPLSLQRIHGDCHLGNLLWGEEGPFFLDFDDMVIGPEVQDVWLLTPGRDSEAVLNREHLLEGYEELRSFSRSTLRMIEPLRGLRFVHYSAWIARRWKDPAFPIAFPQFGSHQYWADEVRDMEEQLRLSREATKI